MVPHARTLSLACLVVLSAFSLPAQDAPPAKLTLEQRKEVTKLLGDYRRARTDLEKKKAAVDRIIEIGGPAIKNMMPVVGKELQGSLLKYKNNFQKKATLAYKDKLKTVDLQRIQTLRAQVLALKEKENLQKEEIVRVADPALAELETSFIVTPEEVFALDKSLLDDREKLLAFGTLWEALVNATSEDLTDEDRLSFPEYLTGEEKLTAQLSAPMDNGTRAILAGNARLARQLDAEEARGILACNLMRNLLGLNALMIDLKLSAAARDHSNDMKTKKFFAHDSPVPGKATPWDRAKNFGTTASGENIFAGRPDGVTANRAWFHSPGHHKNMLGKHVRIGMGRVDRHWTELFGK